MGSKTTIRKTVKFGLIGKKLDYSFSKSYFENKFKSLNLENHSYHNIECKDDRELVLFLSDRIFDFQGVNVTIPYKETVIAFLDELDETAKNVNAVNTILIKDHKLIGYNTDVWGFTVALNTVLKTDIKDALVLGTGGAAKAVNFALKSMGINPLFVSRNPQNKQELSYQDLDKQLMQKNRLLINCTPLGTYPDINNFPPIPYKYLTPNHIVFDLIYNPEETLFLKKAKSMGATTLNGLKMLEEQAEKSWGIWNKKSKF
jgi:shikimate dehydrogenase